MFDDIGEISTGKKKRRGPLIADQWSEVEWSEWSVDCKYNGDYNNYHISCLNKL